MEGVERAVKPKAVSTPAPSPRNSDLGVLSAASTPMHMLGLLDGQHDGTGTAVDHAEDCSICEPSQQWWKPLLNALLYSTTNLARSHCLQNDQTSQKVWKYRAIAS